MQCHASASGGEIWANWCVLVCDEASQPYAEQWLDLYPTCIDPQFINRETFFGRQGTDKGRGLMLRA